MKLESKIVHLQYQVEEQKLGLTKELTENEELIQMVVEDTCSHHVWCVGYVIAKKNLYDNSIVLPLPKEYWEAMDIDWQKLQVAKLINKNQELQAVIQKHIVPTQETMHMWGESASRTGLKEQEVLVGWRIVNVKNLNENIVLKGGENI